ncbi:MAG: LPS export ABC transporter periplasmic protein LptC [Odoribacter sp.]|nr:LPS export ABC transporter periplasmic protein LptC [Odoribacter sp.]
MISHFCKLSKSIIILFWVIMLLSCKNDMEAINQLTTVETLPQVTGEDMIMIYSDSARIRYRITTPLFYQYENEKDFPQGIHVISYNEEGEFEAEITSKYAKQLENENLWEARNDVVVINAEGTKLETELLYWDMEKRIVYTDRYCRLTKGGNILEGNNGLESDDNLQHPVFKRVTGEIEYDLE